MKEKVKIADKVRLLNLSTSEPVKLKCNDEGFIERADGLMECECRRKAREQDHINRLFASAKIPARYRDKTLDNFEVDKQPAAHKVALDYTRTWPKADGESLFLVGPVGTGKSHLARAILAEMIRLHKISGLAATVPNLMDDLRPGANDNRRSEQMELLKTVPLLVLDDLGAQKTTEWVTERLFVIINARYDDLLPTIITSNIYLEELRQLRMGSLVDRIVEMAWRCGWRGNYRIKGRVK